MFLSRLIVVHDVRMFCFYKLKDWGIEKEKVGVRGGSSFKGFIQRVG